MKLEPIDRKLKSRSTVNETIYRHTGTFDGHELTVLYAVDEGEHQRRLRAGIGAITDERTLAALIEAPSHQLGRIRKNLGSAFDEPLTGELANVLDDPDGLRWAQRRVEVPLQVLEIEAHASTWEGGAALVHQLVGYGARSVHLPADAGPISELAYSEAVFYGIGLASGQDEDRIVSPASFVSQRWTSARWRFAELIYEQFRQLTQRLHT